MQENPLAILSESSYWFGVASVAVVLLVITVFCYFNPCNLCGTRGQQNLRGFAGHARQLGNAGADRSETEDSEEQAAEAEESAPYSLRLENGQLVLRHRQTSNPSSPTQSPHSLSQPPQLNNVVEPLGGIQHRLAPNPSLRFSHFQTESGSSGGDTARVVRQPSPVRWPSGTPRYAVESTPTLVQQSSEQATTTDEANRQNEPQNAEQNPQADDAREQEQVARSEGDDLFPVIGIPQTPERLGGARQTPVRYRKRNLRRTPKPLEQSDSTFGLRSTALITTTDTKDISLHERDFKQLGIDTMIGGSDIDIDMSRDEDLKTFAASRDNQPRNSGSGVDTELDV